MKKIILALLLKYIEEITTGWQEKILQSYPEKFTKTQAHTFADSSINILIDVIESGDYSVADQYLIDNYNLFQKVEANLLEISQLFSIGRYSIMNFLEDDHSYKYDPVIILGFIDEIIEQVYARYGVLHQEAQMKELESDRNRLAAKLDVNQEYLSNILHSSDAAIMVIDKNENFISWNHGAEKIFGYTEEEVLNKPSSLLLPEGSKYSKELEFIQSEVRKSGFLKLTETERKTKEGKTVSVTLNVFQLPSSTGEYTGRSVIIKDFTEVKKLQQQVDQSEKLAVIGKLAAGVAHEIGNPLASISAIVQILQRKTNENFTREQLTSVKENIDRISKIVRELVDFSRPPSHEKMFIQITDVIKTALGIVKYDKRVKDVKFETNLDPSLPLLNVVPDQILQVFVNILLNALDAIDGMGDIKVSSYTKNDYVFINMEDNGCGMSENTMANIFDPFFTTKDVGKGTGLGLSVSYGIVKNFKGDILVESVPERGSKFIVKLPIIENLD